MYLISRFKIHRVKAVRFDGRCYSLRFVVYCQTRRIIRHSISRSRSFRPLFTLQTYHCHFYVTIGTSFHFPKRPSSHSLWSFRVFQRNRKAFEILSIVYRPIKSWLFPFSFQLYYDVLIEMLSSSQSPPHPSSKVDSNNFCLVRGIRHSPAAALTGATQFQRDRIDPILCGDHPSHFSWSLRRNFCRRVRWFVKKKKPVADLRFPYELHNQ